MIALKLPDIPLTTHKLFLEEDFDPFLTTELTLSTLVTFQIDAHIPQDYFTEKELANFPDPHFIAWKQLRPVCFQLIRGNRLPGQFRIVFKLSDNDTKNFLIQSGLQYQISDIEGLFINIRYSSKSLSCSTGSSLNIFDMSRRADHAWDQTVKSFLKQHKIPFEEE